MTWRHSLRVVDALQRTPRALLFLLERAGVVVWTTDAELRVTAALGGGLSALGVTPEGAVGKTVAELFASDPDAVVEAHRTAFANGLGSLERPFPALLTADGADTCLGTALLGASPADPIPFSRLADLQPAAIFVLKGERFLFANRALLELLGYTREALLGRDLREVVHAEDCERLVERSHTPAPSGMPPLRQELRFLTRAGGVLWVDLRAATVFIGGEAATLGTLLDVTERKRAEIEHAALEEVAQRLADAPTLEAAAPSLLASACVGLSWSVGALFTVDPSSRTLIPAGQWDALGGSPLTALWRDRTFGKNDGLPGRVFAQGQPVTIADLRKEAGLPEAATGLKTAIGVPIRTRQGIEGVLVFARRGDAAGSDALTTGLIARHVGGFLDRRTAEDALLASEARYRLLFERSLAGVYRKSLNGVILDANEAFARLLGYGSPGELLSHSFVDLYADQAERKLFLERLSRDGHVLNYEIRLKRKDGSVIWSLQNVTLHAGGAGGPYVEGTLLDITERKLAEEALTRLAYHDPLTGLPNRALFFDRLRVELAQAQRGGRGLAVIYLDLDGFKAINDERGHAAGDTLLRVVAERLKASIREGDTAARLGGDEFALILAEIDRGTEAVSVGQKVLSALTSPIPHAGGELLVAASLGVSVYPGDALDPEALVRLADRAMYLAKEKGKGRIELAGAGAVLTRQAGARSLADAVALNELELVFEPVLDTRTQEIGALEAHIRWRHREGKQVPLAEFLALAEESGLIVPIATWSLWGVARQLQTWAAEGSVKVAVALPDGLLRAPQLLRLVDRVLERTGVDPARLRIQVAERTCERLGANAVKVLRAFRERGLPVLLNDVWLGHAPLASLLELPIDQLVADVSLLGDLREGSESTQLVRDAVLASHRLSRRMGARGVSTVSKTVVLARENVDEIQGPAVGELLPGENRLAHMRERWKVAGGR